MIWRLSHRFDPAGAALADRHYNRRAKGSPQFVPPGRCVVLVTLCERAVWVTSWPFAKYVRHAWAGAWVNNLFRNEGAGLSSDLILQAIAATKSIWPMPPALGLITFIDVAKIRHKRDPGRCYLKAGFERVGMTKGGLIALQLAPERMPTAASPTRYDGPLFAEVG